MYEQPVSVNAIVAAVQRRLRAKSVHLHVSQNRSGAAMRCRCGKDTR